MFKKIPGSKHYRINLNCEIIDIYGNKVDLKTSIADFVEIELAGELMVVRKSVLALLAWFEIDINEIVSNQPSEHECTFASVIKNTLFCRNLNNVLKVRCGYTMVFSDPIEYSIGFCYIPSFPRYAIDINGVVLDTVDNSIIDKTMIDSSGYPCHYLYNPDIGSFRWTRTHRLMALTWLPNTDFTNRPFVNHLNGKKEDYSLKNLEWCSQLENNLHALETGLISCNVKMKTRDKRTGQVEYYASAAEMSSKLGLSGVSSSSWMFKMPGYLLKQRYEVKLASDDSPWFYENNDVEHSKAIFTIKVLNKETGVTKLYLNTSVLFREYTLANSRTNKLDDFVLSFKENYPNHEISYVRNSSIGPYVVKNILTNVSIEFSSMLKAGKHIGISRTEIQFDICRSLNYIYDNQWIVIHSGNRGIGIEGFANKRKVTSRVECVTVETGEIVIFSSIREASAKTGIGSRSISKYASTDKQVRGLIFRLLDR